MIDDIHSLLARANTYGLKLTTDKKNFDKSGLDFLVLHANDEDGVPWIVRTPRHPNAYQGTINEAKMLRLLHERLSVAVPQWKVHEQDLIAYPLLQGTPAWSYDPEQGLTWNGVDVKEPQATFLESSARFLAELHNIDRAVIEAAGGRVRSVTDVRNSMAEACESTRSLLNPSDAMWRRWQSWIADDSYWPREASFVHGDFHPGHMLLDESLSLTGVLDWTEAEVADPSVDFGVFFGCFGKENLQKILHLYENAGGKSYGRLADHIMERWAAYAPLVAKWGVVNHNEGVIEHAKNQLAAAQAQMR